jgi:ferredoxin
MANEERWRNSLEPVPGATASPWLLVVHDAASRHWLANFAAPEVRLIEVGSIPEFAETMWMETLALGASALILVVDQAVPSRTLNILARTAAEAKGILSAIGRAEDAITVTTPGAAAMAIDTLLRLGVSTPPTVPVRSESKRTRFLAAVDAIAPTDKPPATRGLKESASFGEVIVDRQGCTLCLACTNLCQTGALTRGSGLPPALMFNESLCVQCDLCRAGCPEKAITLQPRFLQKRSEREAIRILSTDEPVPCSCCGAPFTTKRMLAASMALVDSLQSLTMPGGTEALRQCSTCRQREILAM